ncbi:MAG: cytochrome c3 family protein [Fibrobacter sp.]|nr:cytochrome c3 family protein [Fibrobacter sp.]
MRTRKVKWIVIWAVLIVGGAGLVAWDLASFPEYFYERSSRVPFNHEKHAEALGLDCSKCHVGAEAGIRATMPSKADCMDCHNLPLTESEGIERLDKALLNAPDAPFVFTSLLPSNVVFPHGLHVKSGVSCETCHGSAKEIDAGRRPQVRMQDCLACHQGKLGFPKASTDCARCHR